MAAVARHEASPGPGWPMARPCDAPASPRCPPAWRARPPRGTRRTTLMDPEEGAGRRTSVAVRSAQHLDALHVLEVHVELAPGARRPRLWRASRSRATSAGARNPWRRSPTASAPSAPWARARAASFRFHHRSPRARSAWPAGGRRPLTCKLFDQNQKPLGEGCQQFATLPAGSYLLQVARRAAAPWSRFRPVGARASLALADSPTPSAPPELQFMFGTGPEQAAKVQARAGRGARRDPPARRCCRSSSQAETTASPRRWRRSCSSWCRPLPRGSARADSGCGWAAPSSRGRRRSPTRFSPSARPPPGPPASDAELRSPQSFTSPRAAAADASLVWEAHLAALPKGLLPTCGCTCPPSPRVAERAEVGREHGPAGAAHLIPRARTGAVARAALSRTAAGRSRPSSGSASLAAVADRVRARQAGCRAWPR